MAKRKNISDIPIIEGFVYVPKLGLYLAKKRTLNGLSHDKAVKEIYEKGIEAGKHRAEMPAPFEFMSGLIYVLDTPNIPGLTKQERAEFLDDILKTGYWRGNHLNARFVKGNNGLEIETAALKNGKLVWERKPLESCLSTNCYADIRRINSQGLFTAQSPNQDYVQGQNAYFFSPVTGAVAGFLAGSDGAGLYCLGGPGFANASLGVRLVVRAKNFKQELVYPSLEQVLALGKRHVSEAGREQFEKEVSALYK